MSPANVHAFKVAAHTSYGVAVGTSFYSSMTHRLGAGRQDLLCSVDIQPEVLHKVTVLQRGQRASVQNRSALCLQISTSTAKRNDMLSQIGW